MEVMVSVLLVGVLGFVLGLLLRPSGRSARLPLPSSVDRRWQQLTISEGVS